MFDKLIKLRYKGYTPDTILDIGAYHGLWTFNMKMIYGESKYHLFEAIDYPELNIFRSYSDTYVYNVLLNDKVDEVDWYQMKNTGDSMFKEKTHHFNNCIPIKRKTIDLDKFILENGILKDSKNILMKIDCQGAEIPILKGSKSILDKTDFIILEIPFFGQYNEGVPTFAEHINFMNNMGFVCYEILDTHYINDFCMQIDMMFINKNHTFCKEVNKLIA